MKAEPLPRRRPELRERTTMAEPTTEELIAAAREWGCCDMHGYSDGCALCLTAALSDRLEEVEDHNLPDPDWDAIREYVATCVRHYLGGPYATEREAGVAEEATKAAVHAVYRQLRGLDSPGPSDPEPDHITSTTNLADERSDRLADAVDRIARSRGPVEIGDDGSPRVDVHHLIERVERLERHADRGNESVRLLTDRVRALEEGER